MVKEKLILHWRTAPRSIYVLLRWLPIFYAHQDEDYNLTKPNRYPQLSKGKTVHPTRRIITYEYEKQNTDNPDPFVNIPLEKFMLGCQPEGDRAEKESRVRQANTTAEQLGLMDASNAHLTEVGERVVRGTFDADDLLKQLLKLYIVSNPKDDGVFPFKTFLKLLDKFGYISRNEMTFMFGVLNDKDEILAEKAVFEFREKYNNLPNKNNSKDVKRILKEVWNKYFPSITDKTLFKTIRRDYTDAFRRCLTFTEIFYDHGRGFATKIRPTELNKRKFELLVKTGAFVKPPKNKNGNLTSSRDNIGWFGKSNNVVLPWENREELEKIVKFQIASAIDRFENIPNPSISITELETWDNELNKKSFNELKDIENKIHGALLVVNKDEYIQKTSQTKENRKEILNRYELISKDADESALWLEVNTWKAFVSLHGQDKEVKPNFNMNPDLTPKSFAPGVGDTPDMEVYFDDSAIIPEVSLMVGVQQWEHEGSSVIDHVYKKIEEHKDRRVLGLFISSSINIRTNWQFFLLNRESWIGKPVPVVPLTLKKFVNILEFMYKYNLEIEDFNTLLVAISGITKKLDNYREWDQNSENIIENWKKNKGKLVIAC